MCGWLKDKFGLRRQIVPEAYMSMMYDDDQNKVAGIMAAMRQMVKLDIAELTAAFNGEGSSWS